jgi:hypothetical protein
VQYPRGLLSPATPLYVKSRIISVKAHISIKQLITSMLTSLYATQSVTIITVSNMYSAAMTLGALTLRMEKMARRCGRQQRICEKKAVAKSRHIIFPVWGLDRGACNLSL